MRRHITLALALLSGLPIMAQKWISQLYTGENGMTTEDWIEEYCTMNCRQFLLDEYTDTYESDVRAYATWILYGDINGEDVQVNFSSVETLPESGPYTERKAVHMDVFLPDELAPAFRRTIVLDLKEEDGILMVDSVEYPRDETGMLLQVEMKRKAKRMPEELTSASESIKDALLLHPFDECMQDMPETACCMSINRNTMEPAVGQSFKHTQIHAIQNDDNRLGTLRCIKAHTYYPEAESLATIYETIVYSEKDASPLCHFSTSTMDMNGEILTLEQTFYFSQQGKVLLAERHLMDCEGKEHPIQNDVAVSDGRKELQHAIRMKEAYETLKE